MLSMWAGVNKVNNHPAHRHCPHPPKSELMTRRTRVMEFRQSGHLRPEEYRTTTAPNKGFGNRDQVGRALAKNDHVRFDSSAISQR